MDQVFCHLRLWPVFILPHRLKCSRVQVETNVSSNRHFVVFLLYYLHHVDCVWTHAQIFIRLSKTNAGSFYRGIIQNQHQLINSPSSPVLPSSEYQHFLFAPPLQFIFSISSVSSCIYVVLVCSFDQFSWSLHPTPYEQDQSGSSRSVWLPLFWVEE